MALSQPFSLVKYGRPEHVRGGAFSGLGKERGNIVGQSDFGCGGITDPVLLELMQHACKEAALSQMDKEQILDAIVPPREWEEDGKFFKQLVSISHAPATRDDVSDLSRKLNEQLILRQARPDGLCAIRRELADQCFDELIRQVTISQPERGLLLLRVRDELRMTLSAYQDLFVSARDYDSRKTVALETMDAIAELELKLKEHNGVAREYEAERDELNTYFEETEQILKERRESAFKQHHEQFQLLKRVNNALKQQIDAMMDPENNVDPVIEAYQGVKSKQPRTARRRRSGCEEPAVPTVVPAPAAPEPTT